jgi:hypothetical protein
MSSNNSNTPQPELKTDFEILMIKQKITEINETIKQMELVGKSDSFDFELEIMTQYPDFYQAHPFLVKKLCKRDDITMLYKMLDSLQSVQSGQQSLASVELNLGSQLADKFVYPNLKK